MSRSIHTYLASRSQRTPLAARKENMKTEWEFEAAAQALRRTSKIVILKAADICDGHGIFDPAAFIDAGLPLEVVSALTREFESSTTDPMKAIFKDGEFVPKAKGIYGLEMLKFMALALDVRYAGCFFGRGTQAREIKRALHAHYAEESCHEIT